MADIFDLLSQIAHKNISSSVTFLDPKEEKDFKKWFELRAKLTGTNPNPDEPLHFYDARGYWSQMKRQGIPPTVTGHLPDTYKIPGHPTFSDESIYYKPGIKAGKWVKGEYKELK